MPTAKTQGAKKLAALGAMSRPIPSRLEVQLATLTKEAPDGDEWLHEIKYDGYRMICRVDGKDIKFLSRNHQDWTSRLSSLVTAVQKFRIKQAIFDGEVVVIKSDGTTDFQALQNVFREGHVASLRYFVFDLLYLNGQSLVEMPLELRKEVLESLLAVQKGKSPIHYSDHVIGSGPEVHKHACKMGLEGIISKLRSQPYSAGRGYDWLKVKCVQKEEFVIGGFTEPSGSRVGLGALLVGYYDAQRQLHYAGKVGTGFDLRMLIDMRRLLEPLEQEESPFIDKRSKVGDVRTAHWLKPSLVAQITYGSRTREGILRHAVFAGLREDKPAREVKLDEAMPVKAAVKKSATKRRAKKRPVKGT